MTCPVGERPFKEGGLGKTTQAQHAAGIVIVKGRGHVGQKVLVGGLKEAVNRLYLDVSLFGVVCFVGLGDIAVTIYLSPNGEGFDVGEDPGGGEYVGRTRWHKEPLAPPG